MAERPAGIEAAVARLRPRELCRIGIAPGSPTWSGRILAEVC
jgi:hypothetical protein